jgi:hypothetical protein
MKIVAPAEFAAPAVCMAEISRVEEEVSGFCLVATWASPA